MTRFPAFRFASNESDSDWADEQFWRDVEASRRLPTVPDCERFLDALCAARANREQKAGTVQREALRSRQAELRTEISKRGFGGPRTPQEPKAA